MKYPWTMQEENVDPELEAMLTRSLERSADVPVPVDFAARVRASLPAVAPKRRRRPIGRTVAIVGIGVLTAALFALAPHASPTFGNLAFDVELLVLAELGGLAYWVAAKRV